MAPKQHTGQRLRRNHSNALPRYIISFDTKTRTNVFESTADCAVHSWRLGTAISGRLVGQEIVGARGHLFSSTSQFWSLLTELTASNYTTWVIGHNILASLIYAEFPTRIEQSEYVIDWPRSKRIREDNNADDVHTSSLCIIDSPPTIIALRCVATGGRVVFVDLLNWFPATIGKIADCLGYPRRDKPDDCDSEKIWSDYSLRDSEICFRAFHNLIKWVKSNDMGMFRYTAPSQAMAAFRHRFMRHDVLFHDNEPIKTIERASYFGGRTECFRIGEIEQHVYQLDINSLFPSVMHDGLFPSLLDEYRIQTDYSSSIPSIAWKKALAEVEVETTESIYPIRRKAGIFYPVGRFKTTLCGEELSYAIESGHVRQVKSYASYKLLPIFTDFVEALWDMRQRYKSDNNTIYAEFAKRILNSLYGKFGQRSPSWVNCADRIDNLPWTTWVESCRKTGDPIKHRSFGWQIQKQDEPHEIANTFVAISAFVTSAARMRMNSLRAIAGKRDVYYQGVDSLVVNQVGYDRLNEAGEVGYGILGKLRIDLETDSGRINGNADYTLGDKIVVSGRSSNATTEDREEFYQQKFFAQYNMFRNRPISTIEENRVTWKRQSGFSKGTIEPDGWVSPIIIGRE